MEVENIFYELFKLTAERFFLFRSDGSTLPEGGIDLDISRPSTSFVTKVSKEFIKRSWQRYMPAICRTPMFSEARKELSLSLFGSTQSSTTSPAKKKRKGNTSTDSEGLTGSPKRRRKFLRTSDNYAVSLRKLTKQVGDLREENKKVKQELKVSKARSKWLSDKVDHLKDVIKELVDINLISEDALSDLDKTYCNIPYELILLLFYNT
ncbi:hypothetical protein NQ318_015698 [Aromia moschata]|uniref:Uncharacterized protein n=1 Tax=Aromia moschata TaxID=1265417 RepID=A0AAV8YH91_9CUCU|nr:hypothetical protein NQ318_015698 [Aromia moschata]